MRFLIPPPHSFGFRPRRFNSAIPCFSIAHPLFFSTLPCAFRLYLVRFFDSPHAFSILRALRQRISALFHSTPPHFLSLPACAAHDSLRHRRASPIFSHAHRVCALRFHKKRIHRQHDEQCCRWILFSRRGQSWHRLRLIHIMVWQERGNNHIFATLITSAKTPAAVTAAPAP